MNLEELEALVALHETGSLLGAAERLGVSRARVRRRLEELEARVGAPLFIRQREGAAPTPIGQSIAQRGRLLLHEAEVLRATARELGAEARGVLRVLAPVGLPPQILALLYAHMRAEYPDLELRIRFSGDPVAEALDQVDLAFHFGARTPRGEWITTVVGRARERLIAHVDYLAANPAPERPEDLRHHPLFSWAPPGEDPHLWVYRGGQCELPLALSTADVHMVRQCALAGMGIARAPEGEFPDFDAPEGALVALLPDRFDRDVSVRALVPAAMAEVPKIRLVLQLLRQFMANL